MHTHRGSNFTQFPWEAVCTRNSLLEQERLWFPLLLNFDSDLISAFEIRQQQLNIPKLLQGFLTGLRAVHGNNSNSKVNGQYRSLTLTLTQPFPEQLVCSLSDSSLLQHMKHQQVFLTPGG